MADYTPLAANGLDRVHTRQRAGELDIDDYVGRSRALDLSGIRWGDVPRYPLSAAAVRTLRYMQDIEGHTIVYLREILVTRAIDDPEVATFVACWFYEETFHARALARFLHAAGHDIVRRRRSAASFRTRLEAFGIACVGKLWPRFVAVHMTWGAISELCGSPKCRPRRFGCGIRGLSDLVRTGTCHGRTDDACSRDAPRAQ